MSRTPAHRCSGGYAGQRSAAGEHCGAVVCCDGDRPAAPPRQLDARGGVRR